MDYLGIDFDGNLINLALMDSQKKIIQLSTSPASDVKQLYIAKRKNLKKTCIVSALSSKKVLIKQKTLKVKSKTALKKASPHF